MKNVSRDVRTLVLAAALCLIVVPANARAQAPGEHQHGQDAQAQSHHAMPMKGMQMGQMKMQAPSMDEMAAAKKANTERITSLMAQIKTATGDAKVAAMADLIGILVDERAAMQQHCAAMRATMHK